MFALQIGLSFLAWIGTGWWLTRRPRPAWRLSVGKALGAAVGLFALGLLVLLGSLAGVAALGGLRPEGLTPLGWLWVTLAGVALVVCQSYGLFLLARAVRERR